MPILKKNHNIQIIVICMVGNEEPIKHTTSLFVSCVKNLEAVDAE